MASKVLVPAAPFAKLKVQKSPAEPPPAQGFIVGSDPVTRVAHLEHSVRFLQEQHRLMLSGLHNEIEALRERNRDLQFQLIFNKESASKNYSPNAEDKENTPTENEPKHTEAEMAEVTELKAEVLKLRRETAVARSEARTAEARALQLQRLVDLQAEKLRESERSKVCSGSECETEETRAALRAKLTDADRLVRRLRADAEHQRREVVPSAAGVTNFLFDGAHAQHAHMQCMRNSIAAGLRGSGVEYGYQNYHFAGPDYWGSPHAHNREDCAVGGRGGRGVRVSRRVLTLPELARHTPRNTIYANQHAHGALAMGPPGRVPAYDGTHDDTPHPHQHQHPHVCGLSEPAAPAPAAPAPRPRARRHRKHNDHT